MHLKKKLFLFLSLFLSVNTFSQVLLTSNLYTENNYLTNPAYAGIYVKPHAYISYKKIASSINGTPELLNVGISSEVYKGLSLGGRFYKQSEGLFNSIVGFIDYSYKLKINNKHNIRFGISSGINANKLDYANIIAEDPSAAIDVASRNFEGTYFESSAGIVYQWKKWEVSIAVPKLFESKNKVDLSLSSLILYDLRLKENEISLRPSVFINYSPGNPYLYDINLQAQWKERFWIGAGYRNIPGIKVSAGLNFNNIGIAYATEMSISKFANMFNQTHEISISYTFSRPKKLPNDTLFSPINNLIAKKDTLARDSIKNHKIVEENTLVEEKVDSVIVKKEKNTESDYTIIEVGTGVYVIKPVSIDSTKNDKNMEFAVEKDNISELDSVFAVNLITKIEEDKNQKEYELIESGTGIYILRTDSLKHNSEINEDLLTSILKENDVTSNTNEIAKERKLEEGNKPDGENIVIEKNKLIEKNSILEEKVDSVNKIEKEDISTDYTFVEVGNGVYVVEPVSIDTTENAENLEFAFENDEISEQDSVFAVNFVARIKEDENQKKYELVESGTGVYTVISDSLKGNSEPSENLLTSILKENNITGNKDEKEKNLNTAGAYYHSVYYTLRLYINNANKNLLTYVEVVDKARIEHDKKGNLKYYYGYFSSINEAIKYKKKFSKFDNLETKVQKFHAYQ